MTSLMRERITMSHVSYFSASVWLSLVYRRACRQRTNNRAIQITLSPRPLRRRRCPRPRRSESLMTGCVIISNSASAEGSQTARCRNPRLICNFENSCVRPNPKARSQNCSGRPSMLWHASRLVLIIIAAERSRHNLLHPSVK